MLSFIHCADLHLDSPLVGVRAVAPEIAEALREATFRALDNVVEAAIRRRVDFLVVAGDVYDGADRSLRAQLRFRDALARAAGEGIRCLVAHGNHDPLDGWEADLAMPEGVHRFGADVEKVSISRDGNVVADVYGISYPVRDVTDNLAARFHRDGDAPTAVGVLHCSVGGSSGAGQHEPYAPCSVEDLVAAGIDYWALGHIHAHGVLRDEGPCIAYSGNTQGRSVRELGPRGCYLVRIDKAGRVACEFLPTDVVRWFEREIDIGPIEGIDPLIEELKQLKEDVRTEAEGRAVVVRVNLVGRGELHGLLRRAGVEQDLLARARDGEQDRPNFVWVESLKVATAAAIDVPQRRKVEDFVGDFLRAAEKLRECDDPAAAIRKILADRPEHKAIAAVLDDLTKDELLSVVGEAETMGLDHLLGEE